MKVFISWSGTASLLVADSLRDWLPNVIQAAEPWLSKRDIGGGARWATEVGKELEGSCFGIICLTPSNVSEPWLHFEAGALSKLMENVHVVPYLLGFEPENIDGPMSQFQACKADKEGTLHLVRSINDACQNGGVSSRVVESAFERWWGDLEAGLKKSREEPAETLAPKRETDDMIAEILGIARDLARSDGMTHPLGRFSADSIPQVQAYETFEFLGARGELVEAIVKPSGIGYVEVKMGSADRECTGIFPIREPHGERRFNEVYDAATAFWRRGD